MSSHYAAQAGLELSHPSASCLLSNRSKGMSCHNLCLMSFPLDHPVATGSYIPGHVSVIASCFQYCHQNTANCASEKGTVAVAYFRFPGLSLLVIKKKKESVDSSYFPRDTVQWHSPALVPHGPPHHALILAPSMSSCLRVWPYVKLVAFLFALSIVSVTR